MTVYFNSNKYKLFLIPKQQQTIHIFQVFLGAKKGVMLWVVKFFFVFDVYLENV